MLQKEYVVDREHRMHKLDQLIINAASAEERKSIDTIKQTIQDEAPNADKFKNMCADYGQFIKEGVIKDTSKIIKASA